MTYVVYKRFRAGRGGTTSVGANEDKYKLWYCGGDGRENGVGIFIKAELSGSVIEVERFGDRMMKVMVLGKTAFPIFSVYAPQGGRSEEEKRVFWNGRDLKIWLLGFQYHIE